MLLAGKEEEEGGKGEGGRGCMGLTFLSWGQVEISFSAYHMYIFIYYIAYHVICIVAYIQKVARLQCLRILKVKNFESTLRFVPGMVF